MGPGWTMGVVGHCNLKKKLKTLKLQTADIRCKYISPQTIHSC